MKQTRQNVRSTKATNDEETDHMPTPGVKHHDAYIYIYDATKKSMYTDQTGRFPITSSKGSKYIMVAVELDGNYIDAETIKNRTAKELVEAYNRIWERWKTTGAVNPNWHVLDNEAPEEFKKAIRGNKCTVELTPPDIHRQNVAERAIQTFKNHFVSVLAGLDDSFPIHQWDRLLPQTITTLNLLRQSNVAPNVSAYAYHHGQFDYNRMPLAPLGCAVQFHIKPKNRKTWGEHSMDGWYVRTSPEHYRCHEIYVKATRQTRISDTVYFKHKYITQPTVTPADAIIKAIQDLTQALKGKVNTKGESHLQALTKLQELFRPGNNNDKILQQIERIQQQQQGPRVETQEQQVPRVDQQEAQKLAQKTTQVPRVEPNTAQQQAQTTTPPPPKQNEKQVEVTTQPQESIADRIRARRAAQLQPQLQPQPQPQQSIADRVKERRRNNQELAAQLKEHYDLANAVLDMDTGELLEYRQLLKHPKFAKDWNISAANEFGRLAQGIKGRVKATNTIEFIHKSEVPQDRFKDVTYIKFVCTVRTEKKEPNRTRATMGGNLINYPDDVGTPTANLLLIKIFLNSVVSTPGAKFANADIANFYLMTPLKRPEYAKIKLSDIPDEIIDEYNLKEKATPDGWVYIKVGKGMYGLPQAGSLGHDLLEYRLNKEGYFQSQIVPGFWKHKTRELQFVLVVDDFGIKYIKDDDLDHLITSLEKYYDVAVDKSGKEFVKINLDWDYENRRVHLSMQPYLQKALRQFGVEKPTKPQNSPYPHVPPKYGAKEQFGEEEDSPPSTKEDQKNVQTVTGKFLWYARAVDPMLLTALSALTSQQANPTHKTMERVRQFLDYCATQEPAVLTYNKSDMILAVHSDAGYLNEKNARSRAGGHFYLSNNSKFPPNNGAIHNVAKIIKAVMSSAAEAELGALYINARKAVEIRNILKEMGHPQPPTPIQTDNSTAEGIINSRVQPKRTKAMDMQYHWLRDRGVNQKQFRFFWRPGNTNLGDYWTKHHPPSHHTNMRPEFLTSIRKVMELRARLNKTKV